MRGYNRGIRPTSETLSICVSSLPAGYSRLPDVSVIVTLYDYLGLGGDYIATLIAYLKQNGKKSLRYIERTALSLFDEGVDTLDALNAYIKHKEDSAENFSKIRRLIGASSRELTSREKKAFACWLDEWGFEFDVINRAYEITVDKINEPSVAYMNRVLENWHNSGLNTLEAVEVSLEAYKKSRPRPRRARHSQRHRIGLQDRRIFRSRAPPQLQGGSAAGQGREVELEAGFSSSRVL